LRVVVWALALAAAAGCGGPFMMFPGGSLSGEVASPPADWTLVDSAFMDLELRPEDPYSVTVNYFVKEGKLYVDPDPERTWAKYLAEDDRVRVRFGFDDRVYPLRAVKVSDAGEPFMDFDPTRSVYRLDPR
jgi:hypothetical protein